MSEIVLQFSRAAPPPRHWFWPKPLPVFSSTEWICRLTHSPFSHVDLRLADGTLLGSSDSPDAPCITGNPRGVAIRPPDYQAFAGRRNARIRTTAPKAKKFEEFCRAQLGKPFDRESLRPSVFLSFDFTRRDWRTTDVWYCAELMTRAVEVAELLNYRILIVKNRVTAADLLLIINPLINPDEFAKRLPGIPGSEL